MYTTDGKDFDSRLEINSDNIVEGIKVYRFRNLSLTLVKKLKLFIRLEFALFARKEVKEFDIIHFTNTELFKTL